ncbi:hypothetical protein [Seonamhaeicola maritimus]|uniref:Beta-hexosaminidase bacterial type N-terminal domain-containing protein n=1 Tax=Seonamhaeicola maritimus TaxID=2591822 RepID=A0A5C7GK28_9FLAO|nr:hypothetical protein [Seonamhaeicola maritimus]TXG38634.1 hypothetical protein FUA22_01750 [Seonamhaeicola maritimus]
MKVLLKSISMVLITMVAFSCQPKSNTISIFVEEGIKEKVAFGLNQFETFLIESGNQTIITNSKETAQVILELKNSGSSDDDSFTITNQNNVITISSSHKRGVFYGLQDITEQLKSGESWKDISGKAVDAHYKFRAIKFNLPWFSYRSGENLALHYDTCKDLKFWESFLNMMAENKFNVLSLWNLHPYMFMVQSEKFPKARPFSDEEMKEWQSFFKTIFKMAKDRGIETYIFNWNIFVSKEFGEAYNIGEYSKDSGFWGEGETNALLEEYTREMVSKTINEYENLTGIGITLGERMGGMTSEERRDWINRTMIAALKEANREVKLFYRAPLSAGLSSHGTVSKSTEILTREAIESIDMEDDVYLGFKYNWSHGHSSPKLSIVHGGILTDTYWNPKPKNYKGVYTVRNEDFFALRWAQPDFIRNYLSNNSQDYIGGAIIGSETYIPAKDYITKEEHRTWDYAFERQWLFYKVWGNLLYNNSISDDYFINSLEEKFNIEDATELLNAWKLGSMNANRVASFHRGTWDATLYTEGFTTIGGKFIDINKFINHPVLDSSYVNIKDFVAGKFKEEQITPIELANITEKESNEALAFVKSFKENHQDNKLLQIELNDIEAWGHYGLYFADKIHGGTFLETYRKFGKDGAQFKAVKHLEQAADHWKVYTETMERYNVSEMPYQFDPKFSWRKHIADAENDVSIAKQD